ncbi:hypothetical protein [Streptomyces sp. NPDC004284]|uniref:hypothetical protein n=1 Tax=Streptomyces sp. NPDC004284 TaxID=3364695 RepID=UPI0036BCDFD4
MLSRHVIYRVITFANDGKVAHLGTTLLDPEQYPAAELVALYRERWESELAFDEIKNPPAPAGRSGRGHRRASGRNCGPASPSTTRSAGSPTQRRSPARRWTPTVSPA